MITVVYIIITAVIGLMAWIYFHVIKSMRSDIRKLSDRLPKSHLSQNDIDTSVFSNKMELLSIIDDKMKEVNNKINKLHEEPVDNTERFLFFSDPHPFISFDTVGWGKDNKLDRMKEYLDVSGSDFIICGGDWLTDHNLQTAIDDLDLANTAMTQMFGAKYYPLLGNHDNNDKVEEVPHDTIVSILFWRWGKAYYTFKGKNTRFYVFDTGSIPHLAMDDYKREQAKWFMENLLANNDEHIVIVMHMCQIMDDGGPISSEQAIQLSEIADAYNKRGVYCDHDFKDCTGKVHIILAGHWHADNNYVLNNIPVYIIDDAQEGNFDMVLMDYDNNQLRTVRVGSGENRVINI